MFDSNDSFIRQWGFFGNGETVDKICLHVYDNNNGTNYGVWVRATYAMLEQFAKTFGKVQTFVSLHEKVKLLVLPMTETNCLLVLTVLPSANTEYIAGKINLVMIGYKQDKDHEDHKQFSIGRTYEGGEKTQISVSTVLAQLVVLKAM